MEEKRTSFESGRYWAIEPDVLAEQLGSSRQGLTNTEAELRRTPVGERLSIQSHSDVSLLMRQFRSPLVLLLLAASVVSTALADSKRID